MIQPLNVPKNNGVNFLLTPNHGHMYHKLLPHLGIDGLVIPWGPLPRGAGS